MDKKTLSIVSYLTIIGWLVSYFIYKGQEKNTLASYHLRQAFGLGITSVIYGILVNILVTIFVMISISLASVVSMILSLISLLFLVLLVIGILNANKEEEKPLPIIGKYFEGKFNFIP